LPAPEARSSLQEVELALDRIIRLEDRTQVYTNLATRASLDLGPQACWLLFRLDEFPELDEAGLADHYKVPSTVLDVGIGELASQGMIALSAGSPIVITPAGRETIAALTEARRAGLEDILEGWNPREHPELESLVRKLAGVVLADDDRMVVAATPRSDSA
jgi:DNA-binding MarR family transcriptional regulator